jgi:hypothetical protein
MRKIEAYVFVDTENPGPKRVVRQIRSLDGVVGAPMRFWERRTLS